MAFRAAVDGVAAGVGVVAGADDVDCVGDGVLPADGLLEQPATLWAGRERRPSLRDVEQSYIRYVLEQTAGSQTRAAAILGISRKALWEKRRRFGIP